MKKLLINSILFFSVIAFSQEKDRNLPKGNDAFEDKKFAEAESEYRISLSNNSKKAIAAYNLGTSIYRQNQIAEAKSHFQKSIKIAKTKDEKYKAFHNLGNVLMEEKDYSGAVEAYKNALRNNPNDEETRYNYALAKLYLKNNPPKSDDKNKDKNKDKKDDKKDNKDKDDNKKDNNKDNNKDKEKDKNKDGKNDKDKKDENNQNQENPKPQPGGISKQRLESLLEAVNNEEKKIQEKVNLQKVKGKPVKPEKDW